MAKRRELNEEGSASMAKRRKLNEEDSGSMAELRKLYEEERSISVFELFNYTKSPYELYTFLSRFGSIMAIDVHKDYLYVIFLRSGATDKLKKRRRLHVIGCSYLNITWINDDILKNLTPWHKLESMQARSLIPAPDPESPQNILNVLNDDCISHIFDFCIMSDMTGSGLYELANVCTQFEYIAQQMFKKKYQRDPQLYAELGNFQFHIGTIDDWSLYHWKSLPVIEYFYRAFGESMVDLSFTDKDGSDIACGIAAQYCRKLETIKCSLVSQKSWRDIQQMAKTVKQLHIKWRGYQYHIGLTNIFDQWAFLEVLSISTADRTTLLLPHMKMPKLIDLRLAGVKITNKPRIKCFFEQNNQLESLKLEGITLDIGVEHILDLLPNLKTLYVYDTKHKFRCGDFFVFGRLKKLKELRILLDTNQTTRILDAIAMDHVEIQTLHIKFSCRVRHESSIVDRVCKIKSLKFLEYECPRGKYDLRCCVLELPELIEMKVWDLSIDMAIKLLRHANDGLRNVGFTFNLYRNSEMGHVDKKLETIWTTAQKKHILLTVMVKLLAKKNWFSAEFQEKHRSWLSVEKKVSEYESEEESEDESEYEDED